MDGSTIRTLIGQGSETQTGNPSRRGPRPLGLHMTIALMTWLGSATALPLLRSGFLPWKPARHPDLTARAATLRADLERLLVEAQGEGAATTGEGAPDTATGGAAAGVSGGASQILERLTSEIQAEGRRRLERFLIGIERYQQHPYRRSLTQPPALWQEGDTRLLDYAPRSRRKRPPVLVVPSLINRAYILDLSAETSLMRYLARRGLRPFLLDWGAPGADEQRFTLTDYIAGRLERALEAVLSMTGERPLVMGYCMGGDLALALACRRHRDLAGLALLATPWNFHADRVAAARCGAAFHRLSAGLLQQLGYMPVDMLQTLFNSLDPVQTVLKFEAFARLDPDSDKAKAFVALEDWVNDGVPLAAPVARECLEDWYGANTPHNGVWRVAGEGVAPHRLRQAVGAGGKALPVLLAIPHHDRIVPPASAAPLAEAMPWATVLQPPSGHIGMIIGSRARQALWQPLARWMLEQAR